MRQVDSCSWLNTPRPRLSFRFHGRLKRRLTEITRTGERDMAIDSSCIKCQGSGLALNHRQFRTGRKRSRKRRGVSLAMQRKRISEGHVGMAVEAPRPYMKGWLPGGILPEETRTTPSATTPYSPSVFYETIVVGWSAVFLQAHVSSLPSGCFLLVRSAKPGPRAVRV